MNYESIGTPAPVSRMGGGKQKIFLCPYDDFNVLQKPDAQATNEEDRYLIKTAHTMKSGKGFIEVYTTADMSKLLNEAIGGRDRKSFYPKGEFYYPGESNAIVAFQNKIIHDRFILLFPLPGTSECIQLGSDEFQVTITPTYDTTTNAGDGRGTTFAFECFMHALIKYTASTIPMKPTA